MIVQIPDGAKAGDELTITTNQGQELTVTIPEGAVAGEDLEIPVPMVPRSRQAAVSKGTVESSLGEPSDNDRLAHLALAGYPALSAEAPQASAYQLSRPSAMPAFPPTSEGGPSAPETTDMMQARQEVEAELRARQTAMDAVGRGGDSGVSTPETQLGIKKDRDFVRRNLPMNLQQQYLRRVSVLQDIVNKNVKVPTLHKQLYTEDLRVRAATIRMSYGMEPPHFRMALEESSKSGARWSQMFRPGFNDIVNETFKVGANACIFSKTYITNKQEREQFLRMHVKDSNGILWFELQRELESIYYQRIDFVDVQMYHPLAWGFPDSSKIVTPNPGEPIDPFHGWCARKSMDSVTEMEDVDFLYTLRLRCFPEATFQALSLGKIPAFIQQYIDIHKDTLEEEDEEVEKTALEDSAANKPLWKDEMLDYGLREEEETRASPEEINRQQKGNTGPDVLDAQIKQFKLKGLSAMRVFLRTRGIPDNMKQCQITPKMVKDMAAQLGVRANPDLYWYCLFALRYSLAPEWEAFPRAS